MITNPTLPEGWTSEDLGGECLLIDGYFQSPGDARPHRASVTVDFGKRGWRSGFSVSGALVSPVRYAGRGWQQRLIAAAVAWLRGVMEAR